VDVGNAGCTAVQRAAFLICPGNAGRDDEVLLSAGVEVLGNIAVLAFIPGWLRVGFAQPLQGPRSDPRGYFTIGQSF
jgi:hypothetical protein